MPSLPPSAKLKILCLHGYAQNADFFRQRTGSLRKNLKSTCDFHFLDAPHEATASFLTADADGDGRGKNLGWWNSAGDKERPALSKTYVGLDESLALARQTIADHGPFDGVLGFSQGATLAALLCLAAHPAPPPVRFAVLCAGFMPRDSSLEPLVGALDGAPPRQLLLPTLHVMGEGDQLVPIASSQRLSDCFAPELKAVHVHEGGHFLPSSAELRAQLKEFVTAQAQAAAPRAAPPAASGAPAAAAAAEPPAQEPPSTEA
jgi:predicted esterase